jgi:hypothetical protein
VTDDLEGRPAAAFDRSWSARLVLGIWVVAAAATVVVGVSAGAALTSHEGVVLALSAATAPTSWLVLGLVTALSLRAEFFSSSLAAWLIWAVGVAVSGCFQVWVWRRVRSRQRPESDQLDGVGLPRKR